MKDTSGLMMFGFIDNELTGFTLLSWVIRVNKTLTMALRRNKAGRKIVRETPFSYMLLRMQTSSSIRPNIGLNALQVQRLPMSEPSHQELSPNVNNNYYPFTCKQLESIQAELEKFRICFNGHKY